MKSTTLYYKDAASDKVYRVWIEQSNTTPTYNVQVNFGRRGGTMQPTTKAAGVSLAAAEKAFDKAVAEKLAKGYTVGETTAPAVAAPAAPAAAFIPPMLLNEVDDNLALSYIVDSAWCAQMKYDGIRAQIHKTGDMINVYSRTGKPVAITEKVRQAAVSLSQRDYVIDGELVGEMFNAFDWIDDRFPPYSFRYEVLSGLNFTAGVIELAPTAWTKAEKAAMYDTLKKHGAEGIVFKRISAGYKSGRPNSGGDALKIKFVATASVIVSAEPTGKRSVNMTLADGTQLGSVTIPPNKQVPRPHCVIEVRYLYAHRGGSLTQPVFLMVREDIAASECVESQLRFKNEARA